MHRIWLDFHFHSVYLLLTLQAGIAVVTVKTEDSAVVVNATRGVDNSRLIARTFSALVINSVAIVTDLALVTVVTCPGNVIVNNNKCALHRESKKGRRYTLVHIFAKY